MFLNAALLLTAVIVGASEVNVCVERQPNCDGPEHICSRSVPCHHGNCDDNGQCLCMSCWEGRNCDQYIDRYQPKFLVSTKYVTVSAQDSGALCTAFGYDADQVQTCHEEKPCPCSEIRYSIVLGNLDDLFEIDEVSGHVFVRDGRSLQPGKEYVLVIELSSGGGTGSQAEKKREDSRQEVTINVLPSEVLKARKLLKDDGADKKVDLSVALDDKDQFIEHHISKRSVGRVNGTTLQMVQLSAENKTTLSPGDKVDFKVTISIPPGVTMDLTVEILTSDAETQKAAYELCSAQVDTFPPAVTSTIADIKPQYSNNPLITDVRDEALINFGNITTDSAAAPEDCVIAITFTAVMINNQPYIVQGSNYSIVAGATYDNESYIWIAQATYAADLPSTELPLPSSLWADGPDSIAVDSYATYVLHLFTVTPYASLQFDVFTNDAEPDSFSTGSIILYEAGSNYPCLRENLLSYSYEFMPSPSELTTSRTKMYIGHISNVDNTNRTVANKTENEIVIKFLVGVPNNESLAGTILPLSATVMINDKTIWTSIMNISVEPRDLSTSMQAPAIITVRNSTIAMPPGGSGTITVDIRIPENRFSTIVFEVLAPSIMMNPSVLSICGIQGTYGANIPYALIPEPERESRADDGTYDRAVLNIGRVWNSAMASRTRFLIVPGNDTASTLTLKVTVRSEGPDADGKTVAFKIYEEKDGPVIAEASVTVDILGDGSEIEEDVRNINVTISDTLNASSISIQSDNAIQLVLSLANRTVINSMTLDVMTVLINESVQARICRANVVSIGKKIPCLVKDGINKQVKYNNTYSKEFNDSGTLEFGSICTGEDSADNQIKDSQIVVSAAFELPTQDAATAGQSFTIYGGLKFGTTSIWAGSATYDIANAAPDVTSPTCTVFASSTISEDTPARPGYAALVLLNIKFPPLTRSKYKLTLTSEATEILGICQVYILYLGYNFPCVVPNLWPGNVSRMANTLINYDGYDKKLDSSRTAILDFGSMSNLGNDSFSQTTVLDDNTIIVGVAVKVGHDAIGNLTLKYQLDVGAVPGTVTPVIIPVSSVIPTATTTTTPNATLNAYNVTTDIHVNITKVIVFHLEIPAGTLAEVTVDFVNPNIATNDFGFCSAAITKVGKNLPCLNSSSISPIVDKTGSENCSNSLTMMLGEVCQIAVINDTSENWLRIEVGLNILNPNFVGTITVEASATVGSITTPTYTLSLTSDNSPRPTSEANVTTALVTNDAILAPVGLKTWADVNVTVPRDSSIALLFTALAASISGRAVMTITGIKVAAAGVNVACVKNYTYFEVDPTNSSLVNTSQKDQLKVDFGYVTNTGFTYRQGFNRSYDDQFTISVQFLMGDHPQATPNSQFPLNFIVETDSGYFSEETQMITVARNGTEKPDIKAEATVINPKLFRSNEVVKVGLRLWHSEESRAEPTETGVRLYLPKYINYSSSLVANTTVSELYEAMVTLKITNPFLFSDYFQLNFTLMVDPYEKRGPTAGMINATSIGRIMTKMFGQTIGGARYPLTDDLMFTGKGFYIVFGIVGEGCYDPLGMENGIIQDCQLSTSTVLSAEHGPENARMGTLAGTAWKPALRDSSFKDYLQVDFGNRTRVARIAFQKDPCCRAATSVILQYSDLGAHWSDGHKESSLNYTGDTALMDLATPFEGRMLRIMINDTDEPESKDSKYLGIRVEFYGCVLSAGVAQKDVCSGVSQPIIASDDVTRYRHISVDTGKNAVYACDILPTTWKLGCFCSGDGAAWKILPSYINNIIGYDATNGHTFARDDKNTTLFKSQDCKTWLISTEQELKEAQNAGQFVPSMVIAGLVQNDPTITKIVGNWKATYDGLYLSNAKKLDWAP